MTPQRSIWLARIGESVGCLWSDVAVPLLFRSAPAIFTDIFSQIFIALTVSFGSGRDSWQLVRPRRAELLHTAALHRIPRCGAYAGKFPIRSSPTAYCRLLSSDRTGKEETSRARTSHEAIPHVSSHTLHEADPATSGPRWEHCTRPGRCETQPSLR